MSQGLKGILELLLVPPGSLIVLLLVGLWLMRHRPRLGYGLMGASTALLLFTSLPITAGLLMDTLEPYPALTPEQIAHPEAQAIVVLGGGRRQAAAEYGDDTVKSITLERVRYASLAGEAHRIATSS